MNSEHKIRIAVYGTLKKGYSNSHLTKNSEYLGIGITEPIFDMVNFGGFPGLIKGNLPVQVEVYDVTSDQLRPIDYLEGHPDFYERNKFNVTMEDGSVNECWIYNLMERTEHYDSNRKVKINKDRVLVW